MSTTNGNRYLFVITSFDQEPDRDGSTTARCFEEEP